ncbi:MAG: type IV pilin N-terminal domain-containing protein [Methanospirillaceae archaeon]|nr:type IV pilin N-terminal domain-containing protein [Methanospirillaceae archaeon]
MKKKDSAVSPVVGVLLMLTLTLIVAAIVNSYAGGLVETESKAPSVTIQAEYHQGGDITIRHISGDPIPTSSVTVMIRPTETMGRTGPQNFVVVKKEYIRNDNSGTWSSGITAMRPGDVHHVSGTTPDDIDIMLNDYDIPDEYRIDDTGNLGKTFYLEMYHKNTMISRSEVLIEA